MYSLSPAYHNQTAKSSNFRRQFQTATLRILLSKVLQALRETLEDCGEIFSTFLYLNSFLLISKINDQSDSDSKINSLLIQLLNQKLSLDTFHQPNKTDAEKVKGEVINVFNQANS